jgi:hypothetical protein
MLPPTVSNLKVVFPGAKELKTHVRAFEDDVIDETTLDPILHNMKPLKNPTPDTSTREFEAGMLIGLTTVTMGIAATVNDNAKVHDWLSVE